MDSAKTGSFISQLRKEQGLTQTALADKLNISNRTVSKWENGDGYPDITILPELARELGVTVDELINGEREAAQEEITPQTDYEFTFFENVRDARRAYITFASRKHPVFLLISAIIFLESFVFFALNNFSALSYTFVSIYKALGIAIAVLTGFVVLLMVFYPYYSIWKSKSFNNGVLPEGHIRFSDKIYIYGGSTSYEFEKTNLSEVRITKDIYVLVFGKRIISYIPKSAVGDRQAEFEQYLRSISGSMIQHKTSVKSKVISVLCIILSLYMIGMSCFLSYLKNDSYFYRNIDAKAQYFYDNEEDFETALEKIKADSSFSQSAGESDYAERLRDEYTSLDEISLVAMTKKSFIIFETETGNYYSGYVHCPSNIQPSPVDLGFDYTEIDVEQWKYAEADDVYLKGKSANGERTKGDWFLVKQLSDTWYYYEYHYKY